MDKISKVQPTLGQPVEKLSWRDISVQLRALCKKLKDKKFHSIYGIPRGGYIPAVMLSHMLNKPVALRPHRNTLIVDDIEDSGNTLRKYSHLKAVLVTKIPETTTVFAKSVLPSVWVRFPWESQ